MGRLESFALWIVLMASISISGCRIVRAEFCADVPRNEVKVAPKPRRIPSVPQAAPRILEVRPIPTATVREDRGSLGLGERIIQVFQVPFLIGVGFLLGALFVALRVRASMNRIRSKQLMKGNHR